MTKRKKKKYLLTTNRNNRLESKIVSLTQCQKIDIHSLWNFVIEITALFYSSFWFLISDFISRVFVYQL